jgi:ubiquinol-cytochrome c reductase cytochrome b subunit/menaquinol-cytochrome c reductase cytochrome b/c subunit
MRSVSLSAAVLALALAFTGCGGHDKTATATAPRTVTATALPSRPAVHDAPVADGQRVFEQSGCLACHQLFTRGNSGPGDSLAGIGSRMTRAEIRGALLNPTAPMPSFRQLGRGKLDDLVAYLSALTSNPPGGPPCPDGVDCG